MALVVFRKKILFLGKIDISNSEMLLEILPFFLFYLFLFIYFFLLTEIFITTTSLTTLSLQNLRLQKITIKN